MKTVTARVNFVLLNRGAELIFNGENAWVPFGQFAAKDVPAALEALADDVVTVEYHTVSDPAEREKDRKKFSKRLAGLGDGWVVGEWSPKVVRGFVFEQVMQCAIRREGVQT